MLRHFGPGASDAQQEHRERWLACLLRYVVQAQAVVRVACEVQRHTNELLGRDAPGQSFSVADIDIYVQLVGMTEGRVPFLLDELATVFDIHVHIDSDAVGIKDQKVSA
jgi:hypothetical protein